MNVQKWELEDSDKPWTFEINSREPVSAEECGTEIIVTNLHEEVRTRLIDGTMGGQIRDLVSRTYAYYLAKFVEICINGAKVEGADFTIGAQYSSDEFKFNDVSCVVTAGLGVPQGGAYRDKSAGWHVLCNGRMVIFADKSPLTGWGSGVGLPVFQPKHRPFVGIVFFVSADPEQLPWTTTKSGINEDSLLWQSAKRQMSVVGRAVVSYLDSRYTDEGTDITSKDLQEATGGQRVSILSAVVASKQTFVPPERPQSQTTKIQYDARIDEIKKIAIHLKRPSMSGSEVGRHTFQYFLRNEVGEGE